MRTREELRLRRYHASVWAVIFVSIAVICFWLLHDLVCGIRIEQHPIGAGVSIVDWDEKQELTIAKKSIAHEITDCRITGYCACCTPYAHMNQNENGQVLTASGVFANIGVVVAVDPDVIPLGSAVIVDNREYYALDTGVTGNAVDILMTHEDAHQAGVRYETVYFIPPEEW